MYPWLMHFIASFLISTIGIKTWQWLILFTNCQTLDPANTKMSKHLFQECIMLSVVIREKSCVLSVFSDILPCYISDWFLKVSLFIFISDGKRWKDRHPASSPVSICHITLPWRPDVIMWYEHLNSQILVLLSPLKWLSWEGLFLLPAHLM